MTLDCLIHRRLSCFARNRTKYLVPPLFVSLVTIKKMSSGFSPLPHAHTPNTPRARSNVRALRHDVSHRPPRDGGQARRLQGCQVRTRHFRTSRFFVTSAFFGIRLEKRVGVAGERASPTRASAPSRDGGDRAIACHSARVLALGTRSRSSRVHHSSPTTFRRRRSWQKRKTPATRSRARHLEILFRGGVGTLGQDASPVRRVFGHFFFCSKSFEAHRRSPRPTPRAVTYPR